ncbi:4-hydroxythreonine-4-phosphate dehydrogenase [mine drainage metagenome]|uniref:4-hydroxythreonine-4-phosphate dehydrogenase n=2 Tax=mine drainage metagenome TaxID=410659 RepID=T1CSU0_9ZZZZ
MKRTERVAITLGDPAGIGPEVVAKAISLNPKLLDRVVLFGNRRNFSQTLNSCKLDASILDKVGFVDVPGERINPGMVQKEAGRIAIESIQQAVESVMHDGPASLCTAPINKEAIIAAGSQDIDHTIMLSRLTASKKVSTVFESRKLRILFANKHLPLKLAISGLSTQSLIEAIDMCEEALEALGTKRKRIAIAALNPHAGEGGLLGSEEVEIIRPAIEAMRTKYDVTGPYPADSVFYRASKGEFDIVLSLYHDQGHIAAKMLDFHGTVSMNLGLPFLRTSVDHGTAYEIAGKNRANPASMIVAIRTALKYSERYRKYMRSSLLP